MATEPRKSERPAHRVRPGVVIAVLVGVLALVFVLQNRDPVAIHLATLTVSAPLWLLLTVMTAVGALLGYVVARRR